MGLNRQNFLLQRVLPVILVFCSLSLTCLADALENEDRVLRVQDGSLVRLYPVTELIEAVGLQELRVPLDPHFGPNRSFAGFPLQPLLEYIQLGDAQELLLVCADGYRIPFDVSVSAQPGIQGLLAIRDTDMPSDGASRWPTFQHGTENISFDPFYLIWTSKDDTIDLGTEVLPWPFQLTEIQRFDREKYYAPAQPPAGSADGVIDGFRIYASYCGKCHRMRGVGGDVGPAFDRQGSLASVFTLEQLADFIRHDKKRFPKSKMRQYSDLLQAAEIEHVARYLQEMQPER